MTEETQNPVREEIQPVKKQKRLSRSIHELLGGDYLSRGYVIGNLFFVMYVATFAMIYIGNTYYAEKTFKDIERTKVELKELRFQYITAKAQLMYNGRLSEIEKRITPFGLKETTTPPYRIFYSKSMLPQNRDSVAEE